MKDKIKEADKLLEQVLRPLLACEPQCKLDLNPKKLKKALSLLKQPDCSPSAGELRDFFEHWSSHCPQVNDEECCSLASTIKRGLQACDLLEAKGKEILVLKGDRTEADVIITAKDKTIKEMAEEIKQYRIALSNIGAGSIIANTIESMKFTANKALNKGE